MTIGRCRSGANEARVRAVFDVRLSVAEDRTIAQMSQIPPALQDDSTVEWLPFRSDNDAIVLAPIPGVRFAPVQLEAGEFQSVEGDEQVLRPLETVATFPDAMINKKIIENWRGEHAVLPPELAGGGVSTLCQQLCLLPIHSWRKGRKLVGQRFGLGRITLRHLE